MADPDVVAAWLRLGAETPAASIRVVLADIDGVLTPGEGATVAPAILERVARWNDEALVDPHVPGIALCTGRQAPYVELLAQLTRGFLPCLFEHGAGMLEPRQFRFSFNPALGASPWRAVAAVREVLAEPLLDPGRAFVQPGKEATLTLYPLAPTTVRQVAEAARAALDRAGIGFRVVENIRGVEVRPEGIDKGAGVRWLAARLGIELDRFAGVGDADDDLSFLRLVGYPASPANGSAAVRSVARFVATDRFGDGLVQVLEQVASLNRRGGVE